MFSPWLRPACPPPWRSPPPPHPPCLLCPALRAIVVVLLPHLAGAAIVVAATRFLHIPTSPPSTCHHWLVVKCPLSVLLQSFWALSLFVLARWNILAWRPSAGPCNHAGHTWPVVVVIAALDYYSTLCRCSKVLKVRQNYRWKSYMKIMQKTKSKIGLFRIGVWMILLDNFGLTTLRVISGSLWKS